MCDFCKPITESKNGGGNCKTLFCKNGYSETSHVPEEQRFNKPKLNGYIGYRVSHGTNERIPKILIGFSEQMDASTDPHNKKFYGWHVDINYCPMCGKKLK